MKGGTDVAIKFFDWLKPKEKASPEQRRTETESRVQKALEASAKLRRFLLENPWPGRRQ